MFLQPLRNSLLNECWPTCQDRMWYLLWQKQGVTHHLKAENIFQRARVSEPCLCSKVSELRDSTRIWGIKTKQSCKGLGKWRPKRVNWKGVNRAWALLRWIKRLGKRISKLLCWEQSYNGGTNSPSSVQWLWAIPDPASLTAHSIKCLFTTRSIYMIIQRIHFPTEGRSTSFTNRKAKLKNLSFDHS